jgi:hypothetical protein
MFNGVFSIHLGINEQNEAAISRFRLVENPWNLSRFRSRNLALNSVWSLTQTQETSACCLAAAIQRKRRLI